MSAEAHAMSNERRTSAATEPQILAIMMILPP